MLDRLAHELFAADDLDPAAVLHEGVTQEIELSDGQARLRLALPLARKGEISLKKIGLELIVRVDGHKRMIMLPTALAGYEPQGARFEDGSLEVTFRGSIRPGAGDDR